MSPESTLKILTLRNRARMLAATRSFFAERNILEVDCGALVKRAPIDSNIDIIEASISSKEIGFLHSSPEYAMKRLLALKGPEKIGDIYYLGHVYRKGEIGRLHNPEFTMAEWYRVGMSFAELIQETADLLFLFLGKQTIRHLSYREAFDFYIGIDYSKASLETLKEKAHQFSIYLPPDTTDWSRETYLHLLLSHQIEPKLGQEELTILTDYPPQEAALAALIEKNGERVAERFEVYFKGIELANGYHEFSEPRELAKRFSQENALRKIAGKETYLLDEEFLSAMENGLPDCCGVSVGFDRAFMIQTGARSIQEVISFYSEKDGCQK